MSEWIESDETAPLWKLVDMTHNKDVMARERDEAQAQRDEYRAQVDRLARALVIHEPWPDADWDRWCRTCDHTHLDILNHAKDCAYVWAVEHVAELEDQ